jgi:hypothetical protein
MHHAILTPRRLFALALALASVGAPAPVPSSPLISSDRTEVALEPRTTNFPEVRIRRLHLVRPDLISYPLSYEIYC